MAIFGLLGRKLVHLQGFDPVQQTRMGSEGFKKPVISTVSVDLILSLMLIGSNLAIRVPSTLIPQNHHGGYLQISPKSSPQVELGPARRPLSARLFHDHIHVSSRGSTFSLLLSDWCPGRTWSGQFSGFSSDPGLLWAWPIYLRHKIDMRFFPSNGPWSSEITQYFISSAGFWVLFSSIRLRRQSMLGLEWLYRWALYERMAHWAMKIRESSLSPSTAKLDWACLDAGFVTLLRSNDVKVR